MHWPSAPCQPALQEQFALPAAESVCSGQDWQCVWSPASYLPAAQSSQPSANAPEYHPSAQPVHASEPGPGLYVPAAQTTHAVVPCHPALHEHASTDELAAAEFWFAAHT